MGFDSGWSSRWDRDDDEPKDRPISPRPVPEVPIAPVVRSTDAADSSHEATYHLTPEFTRGDGHDDDLDEYNFGPEFVRGEPNYASDMTTTHIAEIIRTMGVSDGTPSTTEPTSVEIVSSRHRTHLGTEGLEEYGATALTPAQEGEEAIPRAAPTTVAEQPAHSDADVSEASRADAAALDDQETRAADQLEAAAHMAPKDAPDDELTGDYHPAEVASDRPSGPGDQTPQGYVAEATELRETDVRAVLSDRSTLDSVADGDRFAGTDERPEAGPPFETDPPPEVTRPIDAPTHPEMSEHGLPSGMISPIPALVDPMLYESAAIASITLHAATQWQRLIAQRLEQIGQLVDRTLGLALLRYRSDLVEELKALDLTDPNACLHTIATVLAEALGQERVADRPANFDRWFGTLSALADQADQFRPEVKVVTAPDGTVDGRLLEMPPTGVEVRESVGVMSGAFNRLHVTHLCVVEQPVIEIADLVKMATDGPVFDWSAWAFSPAPASPDGDVSVQSSPLRDGYWTNIWNCRGVTVGSHNSVDLTYVYKMASCHVNLTPLLRNADVRADLAAYLDEAPENAALAEEAGRRLPQTVADAAKAIDLSSLVSQEDVAANAAQIRRPRVRSRGGLVISHGVGVAIGLDPRVTSATNTRIGAFRVR